MSGTDRGRIILVELLDPQGRNPKVRPAVITSPDDFAAVTGTVDVVAITTQTDQAPPDVCVPLPWHRDGHPRTQLRRPGVAVCTWRANVPLEAIVESKGFVPGQPLRQILALIDGLDE